MTTATSLSADTRPAYVEFSLLESWLASADALQLPLHLIESQQQAKGREVQRLLLQAHLQHRGNGDVGAALQLEQPDGAGLYSHRRLSTRSLTTVFGTVELVRMGYSRQSGPSIFPLDKALALLLTPHRTADKRQEGQQETNGHGGYRLPPCALCADPTTIHQKLFPPRPPGIGGDASPPPPGKKASGGDFAQGQDRRYRGGG